MDASDRSGDRRAPAHGGLAASQPPAISLPKGGGALRGIGEKFATSSVTGTGAMSVPIATSPGRAGFGPQLALSYDSGAGNGSFGFGWSLGLPQIARKTDKGLPQYRDADESDLFILAGAEDLVPEFGKDALGKHAIIDQARTIGGAAYQVRRYRPRVEGLFARIERWTNLADPADVFWRTITKDNTTTWYGKTDTSRIYNPDDRQRIFSWLICESYDDKGNAIAYEYVAENDANVDRSQANERNRARTANRYLKHIRYGNHAPYLPQLTAHAAWPAPPDGQWFFQVVFDYGEHDPANPLPGDAAAWPARNDPFSSYRSGFEVRTYRLCQRVLMFHHFPDEDDLGANCLVRSTDFTYSYEENPADARNPIFSYLRSVTQTGYKRQGATAYLARSLPPVEFTYPSGFESRACVRCWCARRGTAIARCVAPTRPASPFAIAAGSNATSASRQAISCVRLCPLVSAAVCTSAVCCAEPAARSTSRRPKGDRQASAIASAPRCINRMDMTISGNSDGIPPRAKAPGLPAAVNVTIAGHPSDDLAIGTERSILRQAQLDEDKNND